MKRKKGERNIWTTIIKLIVFAIVLTLQVVSFIYIYKGSVVFGQTFSAVTRVLQIIVVVYILYGHEKLAYKIPWLILIMFMPIAGIIIYFLWGQNRVGKRMRVARDKTIANSHLLLHDDKKVLENIESEDKQVAKQVQLLKTLSGYPIYNNEGVEYFEIGENYFDRLLEDLKKAKKYILIEFFIIAKGKLFNKVMEVLKERALAGVKIIIIADGWGSLLRYPRNSIAELEDYGIIVKRYNPLRFGVNTYMNYRDHRKIVVIDGSIAYTGGVNIADEYANEQIRFGHWKDNGIRIYGKAVQSYTIAFLRNYEIVTNKVPDYEWYVDNEVNHELKLKNINGYSMFFTDGPDNRKNPAENAYIQILNTAKEYVYIYTPYFVSSPEMLNSILNASRSGIDVRIITPSKPDKWYVHLTTRSYYDVLVEAGVKVYEYLPGFLHAKTFVSDDNTAIVGSINLDYRSLNLNYECAMWMHGTGVEQDIKKDFLATLENSKQITKEDIFKKNIITKILEAIMNTFAPLM